MKLLLTVLLSAVAASATVLTPDNFDEVTAGKTLFVKMFAPWCGHCKRMKPHWDKLMKEYDGHKSILIADCDCTGACKPICDANGVKGFPTVKYGDPNALEDYQGGREYDDIAEFAKDLKPACSPSNDEFCDEAEKAKIAELMDLSSDELSASINAKETEMEDAESTFKSEVEKLQSAYEKLVEAKDTAVAAVKDSGLGLMKSVLAHKAATAKEEL